MQERFYLVKKPDETPKPVQTCKLCGTALYSGNTVYLTQKDLIYIGCENCICEKFAN